MAHTPEESARYILTIFKRQRCMTGGSVLAGNLTLPFQQDGWSLADLDEGQKFGVEQGWMELGKDNKFMKLTEAGYGQYGSVAE